MLRRFVDFLAKMGLAVRDDPPKVIDFATREWGPRQGDWMLSVETVPGRDKGDLPSLSVVLRNAGTSPRRITVPGWLHFYSLELRDGAGREIPMAPFGKTALQPSRRTERIEARLEPGGWTETMIPLGSFFNLRGLGGLRVSAKALVDEGKTLVSNTAAV
ncbi:MAG: hypothetical protein JWN34_6137 [Bryobacterales bacterium]|nr:hypothetical protein [Bryobacterales bacterium]